MKVAYFAAQSDYSCSGADAGNEIFRTDDPWLMGNQRLDRQRLAAFTGLGEEKR